MKAALRKRMLLKRNEIAKSNRDKRSRTLCERAISLCDDFISARSFTQSSPTIAVYSALGSEADAGDFIRHAYRAGWRVCFPCMERVEGSERALMRFYQLDESVFADWERWPEFMRKPARAVPESEQARQGLVRVEPEQFDLVLVPLVAFDEQRNRLGYGGGNYDRFLARVRPDTLVFAIAFAEQQADRVPIEEYDLPLPIVLSE